MDDLFQSIGRTMSGQQLNQLLDGMPLVKFMCTNDKHYEMQYVTGRNLDILPFNGKGRCSPGGIYVTTIGTWMEHYSDYGNYARRVRIDPDALVYIEDKQLKCDEVVLEERFLKDDLLKILFTEYIQYLRDKKSTEIVDKFINEMIDSNPFVVKFIRQDFLTPDKNSEIDSLYFNTSKFIDSKLLTPQIMIRAVKANCNFIRCIQNEHRTPELVRAFVAQYHWIKEEEVTSELIALTFKRYDFSYRKDYF